MIKSIIFSFVIFSSIIFYNSVFAEMYMWYDKSGVVHYSDTQPFKDVQDIIIEEVNTFEEPETNYTPIDSDNTNDTLVAGYAIRMWLRSCDINSSKHVKISEMMEKAFIAYLKELGFERTSTPPPKASTEFPRAIEPPLYYVGTPPGYTPTYYVRLLKEKLKNPRGVARYNLILSASLSWFNEKSPIVVENYGSGVKLEQRQLADKFKKWYCTTLYKYAMEVCSEELF